MSMRRKRRRKGREEEEGRGMPKDGCWADETGGRKISGRVIMDCRCARNCGRVWVAIDIPP